MPAPALPCFCGSLEYGVQEFRTRERACCTRLVAADIGRKGVRRREQRLEGGSVAGGHDLGRRDERRVIGVRLGVIAGGRRVKVLSPTDGSGVRAHVRRGSERRPERRALWRPRARALGLGED